MRLQTLPTILAFVSFTSGALVTKSNSTSSDSNSNGIVSKTVEESANYTHEVTLEGGKRSIESSLNITQDTVKSIKYERYDDPDSNTRGFSKTALFFHNPNGINLMQVKNISKNLDQEFVNAAIKEETKRRQEKIQN